jgi:hypothetical protein
MASKMLVLGLALKGLIWRIDRAVGPDWGFAYVANCEA